MMPEIGKLVPTRPPAKRSVAKTMHADHDGHPQDARSTAGRRRRPSRCRILPGPQLPPDHREAGDQAQQQGQVVVPGVRPHLGQEAGADLPEALGHRDRVGVADELVAAPEEQHAGQRDDERRHADVGDPEALPGADRPRRPTRPKQDRQRPGQVPLRASPWRPRCRRTRRPSRPTGRCGRRRSPSACRWPGSGCRSTAGSARSGCPTAASGRRSGTGRAGRSPPA